MYIAIIFLVIFIVIGYFWGRHTIQRDVSRTEQEEQEMTKLKKMRSGEQKP